MWCDNCLLIFPLRAGGMALLAFIALYQIAGGIFLFLYGSLFYFMTYEPQIYGGIAMTIAALCVLAAVGFSNSSYFMVRIAFVVFPFILILAAVRAGFMVFEFNAHTDKLQWECDNGRQMWNASIANTTMAAGNRTVSADGYNGYLVPEKFCSIGVHQSYLTFVAALILDFIFLVYAYFLDYRMMARIRHAYSLVSKNTAGPYGYA